MNPITLELDRLRLVVAPDLGAGVADLSLRAPDGSFCPLWRRTTSPTPAYFNDLASYTLAPWSNRIPAGDFEFRGTRHHVRPDWPDNTAIHGDVKSRAFRLLDRSPICACLRYDSRSARDSNFPWNFVCDTRYELGSQEILTEVSITNVGRSPFPVGVGFHPYFMRRLWNPADEVVVTGDFAGRYPAVGMIPTGPASPDRVTEHLRSGRPLGTLELDDVFTCPSAAVSVRWPASGVTARYECSPNLSHAVVYSPLLPTGEPAPTFCLEPVSMVNDGFNLLARGQTGTGIEVRAPGESFCVSWKMLLAVE